MSHDEQEEEYPAVSYEDVVADINTHDACENITCERAFPSGYVTFTFYQSGECRGKITFDELEQDTAFRAKAVLDFISSTPHMLIDQVDIERAWEDADPEAVHVSRFR